MRAALAPPLRRLQPCCHPEAAHVFPIPAPQRWSRLAWLSLYTAITALIAIAIAATNIPWQENPGGALGLSYLAVALPGHFLAFGALASLLPALLLPWLRSHRTFIVVAVISQTLWLCLLLADAKVFALYRFHMNAMVLNMVFGGALQDQVSLSSANWLQIALVLLAVVVGQALLAWASWRLLPPRLSRRRTVLVAASLAAAWMAGGQLLTMYYDARGERAVIAQWAYLPWAQPITAKRQMRALGVPVRDPQTLPDDRLSELAYPAQPLRCQGGARPNILMVVMESLRHDALDARTMPNAMALAGRSQVFDQHFSSGNATRFGLFGLLYGLPGGYWKPMLAEQRGSVLFDVLQQQGYSLHIHGSAPLYSPEFDRTAFARVRDQLHTAPSALKVAARDRHIVDDLGSQIAGAGKEQPWFGFVFLDATHAPYHLPDGYAPLDLPMATSIDFLGLDNDHIPTAELNRYRTAVHYADSLLGDLLRTLRDSGQEQNTIVLVTGDHAEEFNDLKLGYWGHNGNFSDAQLHVPFILHWPGRPAAHEQRTSSHEDWVPTLLRHALGCENALTDFSTGEDLLAAPTATRRALTVESWSQRAVRHGDVIYVFDKFGNATALDRHYRPLPQQATDATAIRSAWEALTRFGNRRPARADRG